MGYAKLLGSALILSSINLSAQTLPQMAFYDCPAAVAGQVIVGTTYTVGDGSGKRVNDVAFAEFPLNRAAATDKRVHLARVFISMGTAIEESVTAFHGDRDSRVPATMEGFPLLLAGELGAVPKSAVEVDEGGPDIIGPGGLDDGGSSEVFFEPMVVKGPAFGEALRRGPIPEPTPKTPPKNPHEETARRLELVADFYEAKLDELGLLVVDPAGDRNQEKYHEVFSTARKLAKHIREQGQYRGRAYAKGAWRGGEESVSFSFGMDRGAPEMVLEAAGFEAGGLERVGGGNNDLVAVAGGMQGWAPFVRLVEQGQVPQASAFVFDAYLRTFDLYVPVPNDGKKLIAPSVPYYFDSATGELTFHVGLAINATPETFADRPKAVQFMIDVSGSMGATDGLGYGEVVSRIEGVKRYLAGVLKFFGDRDLISLHLFGDTARTVLPPTYMTASGKRKVRELLATISDESQGTEIMGAFDASLRAVVDTKGMLGNDPRYIHSAVMLTDFNVYVNKEQLLAKTLALSRQAKLIVVSVGDNFPPELTQAVTASSGISLFIPNGKELVEAIDRFARLIIPLASDLIIQPVLDIPGYTATLAGQFGFNAEEPNPGRLHIPELYVGSRKSDGGGAQVVTFKIKKVTP